jgi:hypothetical protein
MLDLSVGPPELSPSIPAAARSSTTDVILRPDESGRVEVSLTSSGVILRPDEFGRVEGSLSSDLFGDWVPSLLDRRKPDEKEGVTAPFPTPSSW